MKLNNHGSAAIGVFAVLALFSAFWYFMGRSDQRNHPTQPFPIVANAK